MVGLRAFAHDIEAQYQGKTIYYKWINNNTELQVTYRGSSRYDYTNWYGGDIRIPESVTYNSQTYNVTSIASYAFYNCNVDRVFLPDAVTEIQDYAFCGSKISQFYGSDNLTKIGKGVFYDCPYLSGDIILPKTVTEIGGSLANNGNVGFYVASNNQKYSSYYNYAIYENDSHKLVSACGLFPSSMPSYFTGIGAYAFIGVSLTTLTIPSNVTSIDDYAFYGCNINSIILPTGLTSIGEYVFSRSALTSMEIPNTVTNIGRYAFEHCTGLTSITIPNSVTSIGNQAFFYCSALTSVTIPYSVTSIGMQAFSYCSNLTSVTIGNSVTNIGEQAFGYCNSLTEVTVERKTPITIATTTFSNRTNATLYVPLGCKEAYEAASIWKNFKEIKEIGKDMSSSDITINPISAVTYNGSAQTPTVTVKDGTLTLANGTDYTVSYSNNINAGTATVTITGKGSYTGTKDANFTINPKNASYLSISSISAVTYNGLAHTPAVTVMDGSTTLTSGTHYTVAYSNNTNAGTATVTITGMGNYTSTKNANFTINKAPLTITAKSYTITEGDPLPSFECTYSGFKNGETESVLTTLPTITCDATDSETAGEYDITPSGAAATNYSFNYVSGTLTINEITSVSIAINSLGKGTYCSKFPIDFTGVSGIDAYIISGFDPSSGKLIRTRVWEVPAETGLFIIGTPGATFNIPVKETDFYYANLMKGITVATVIPTYEENCTNFILASNGNGGVYFTRSNGYGTTAANRAYVQIPTSLVGAREFLDIEDDNDSTTGLDGVFTPDTKEAEGDYYNLSGQKVQTPRKGIYIKNGKKIFIH